MKLNTKKKGRKLTLQRKNSKQNQQKENNFLTYTVYRGREEKKQRVVIDRNR